MSSILNNKIFRRGKKNLTSEESALGRRPLQSFQISESNKAASVDNEIICGIGEKSVFKLKQGKEEKNKKMPKLEKKASKKIKATKTKIQKKETLGMQVRLCCISNQSSSPGSSVVSSTVDELKTPQEKSQCFSELQTVGRSFHLEMNKEITSSTENTIPNDLKDAEHPKSYCQEFLSQNNALRQNGESENDEVQVEADSTVEDILPVLEILPEDLPESRWIEIAESIKSVLSQIEQENAVLVDNLEVISAENRLLEKVITAAEDLIIAEVTVFDTFDNIL